MSHKISWNRLSSMWWHFSTSCISFSWIMCCCLFGGNAAASLKKSIYFYLAVMCQGHTAHSLEMGPPSTYTVLKVLVKYWDGKLFHFLKLHYLGDLIFFPATSVYVFEFVQTQGSIRSTEKMQGCVGLPPQGLNMWDGFITWSTWSEHAVVQGTANISSLSSSDCF